MFQKQRAGLVPSNRFKRKKSILTVPRRFFRCGSLFHVFGVGFGDVSPYVCTDCFVFGLGLAKELLTRLTICSLCIMSICNYSYFQFWFSSRKHLRTKVTPDFHLTYSKNGGNLGSESK